MVEFHAVRAPFLVGPSEMTLAFEQRAGSPTEKIYSLPPSSVKMEMLTPDLKIPPSDTGEIAESLIKDLVHNSRIQALPQSTGAFVRTSRNTS